MRRFRYAAPLLPLLFLGLESASAQAAPPRDSARLRTSALVGTVVDTIGAGDSFTAAMTLGLLAGWDLDRINDHANRVAAFVCSSAGATPTLPAELRNLFAAAAPPSLTP